MHHCLKFVIVIRKVFKISEIKHLQTQKSTLHGDSQFHTSVKFSDYISWINIFQLIFSHGIYLFIYLLYYPRKTNHGYFRNKVNLKNMACRRGCWNVPGSTCFPKSDFSARFLVLMTTHDVCLKGERPVFEPRQKLVFLMIFYGSQTNTTFYFEDSRNTEFPSFQ